MDCQFEFSNHIIRGIATMRQWRLNPHQSNKLIATPLIMAKQRGHMLNFYNAIAIVTTESTDDDTESAKNSSDGSDTDNVDTTVDLHK